MVHYLYWNAMACGIACILDVVILCFLFKQNDNEGLAMTRDSRCRVSFRLSNNILHNFFLPVSAQGIQKILHAVTFQEAGEVHEGKTDSMVCHAILRIIIRSNLLAAIRGADQIPASGSAVGDVL